jgi:hypothetical protein
VHIAGFAADPRLIDFNVATEHSASEIILHGESAALKRPPKASSCKTGNEQVCVTVLNHALTADLMPE